VARARGVLGGTAMPMFWAWRAWPSSRRYSAGRPDDGRSPAIVIRGRDRYRPRCRKELGSCSCRISPAAMFMHIFSSARPASCGDAEPCMPSGHGVGILQPDRRGPAAPFGVGRADATTGPAAIPWPWSGRRVQSPSAGLEECEHFLGGVRGRQQFLHVRGHSGGGAGAFEHLVFVFCDCGGKVVRVRGQCEAE
jgi:hypothetical protein